MILTYPIEDGMAMRSYLHFRVLCWPNEEILETWFVGVALIRLSEVER